MPGSRTRGFVPGEGLFSRWAPRVSAAAEEFESRAAEALVILHRRKGLAGAGERDADVSPAWFSPGHVDGMAVVVNDPGVVLPAETSEREAFGVAQARPADRDVLPAAFCNCGDE